MGRIITTSLFLLVSCTSGSACTSRAELLRHRPPMVEQMQDKRLTTPSKAPKQQLLRELSVGGKTYRLMRTAFDFVWQKDEKIGESYSGTLKLSEVSWHEDFTSEAICGDFFNYRTSDGKGLDAFIIAFASGDVKIYLFHKKAPVAYPYTAAFNGGVDCSIKIRREGTKTLFEITGANGSNAVYDLKDGEL